MGSCRNLRAFFISRYYYANQYILERTRRDNNIGRYLRYVRISYFCLMVIRIRSSHKRCKDCACTIFSEKYYFLSLQLPVNGRWILIRDYEKKSPKPVPKWNYVLRLKKYFYGRLLKKLMIIDVGTKFKNNWS